MVERRACTSEVLGSSPGRGSKVCGSSSEAECSVHIREVEISKFSSRTNPHAALTQLVECFLDVEVVGGSIPSSRTIHGSMGELAKPPPSQGGDSGIVPRWSYQLTAANAKRRAASPSSWF